MRVESTLGLYRDNEKKMEATILYIRVLNNREGRNGSLQ